MRYLTHYFFAQKQTNGKEVTLEKRRYKTITLEDRKKISNWYINGDRVDDIAERLDMNIASIYRELQKGETGSLDQNGRQTYAPELAQRNYMKNLRKRGRNPREELHG